MLQRVAEAEADAVAVCSSADGWDNVASGYDGGDDGDWRVDHLPKPCSYDAAYCD